MAFENIPAPSIVEAISYEEILAEMLLDAQARFLAAGVTYDVGNLETDPVKIALEAAAYREVIVRARGNAIALENLIALSTGSNLDHLAAFHDVTRLTNETDDRLRRRVALSISGRSTAGGADWYKASALRASIYVRDVAVYRTGIGPQIEIAVLADTSGGIAHPTILAAVNAEVQKDSVRVVSDVINVVQAVSTTINISANIWILPTASQTVFDGLEASLREAWDKEGGLGFDLRRSWLIAKLFAPGVSLVDLVTPTGDTVVGNIDAIRLGTISLTFRGRTR